MSGPEDKKSALTVNAGIPQPPSINESAAKKFNAGGKRNLTVSEYVDGILKGDITVLSRAITLIESSLLKHEQFASEIIERCLPHSGNSIRIGITGVPGVGKSTFIESLGLYLADQGKKLAVLAIDPSSERSKGSILGDKTRMEKLSVNRNAFIRPSPSAGTLGGVARKTRETIILCEAAGYQVIFIETVGVGQSEIAVHSLTDFFLLLMLSGAGDELQGIKRGIMEMADLVVINKADEDNIKKADLAKAIYQEALHLFPPSPSGWIPRVHTCSAWLNTGISEIWNEIDSYSKITGTNGYFDLNRRDQAIYWMFTGINDTLQQHFYRHEQIRNRLPELKQLVSTGSISPYAAAKQLLDEYYKIR